MTNTTQALLDAMREALKQAGGALEACRRWHRGDKFRSSKDDAEREAWVRQERLIHNALKTIEPIPLYGAEVKLMDSLAKNQREKAWFAVTEVLDKVAPDWRDLPGKNGLDKAVKAIERLAANAANAVPDFDANESAKVADNEACHQQIGRNAAPVQKTEHCGKSSCKTCDDQIAYEASAPVLDVADELARFETFAKEHFFDLDSGEHGYKSWPTRMAWNVWQETRRAALSRPIAKDEPVAGLAFVEHPDGTMTGLIAATNNQLTTLGKEQLIKAARDLGLPPITIE